MKKIINLDIGGTIFKFDRKLLDKSENFKKFVEKYDDSKIIFVDDDPELFRIYLNFLRYEKIVIFELKDISCVVPIFHKYGLNEELTKKADAAMLLYRNKFERQNSYLF